MEDVRLPESCYSIETRQWLDIILGQNGVYLIAYIYIYIYLIAYTVN